MLSKKKWKVSNQSRYGKFRCVFVRKVGFSWPRDAKQRSMALQLERCQRGWGPWIRPSENQRRAPKAGFVGGQVKAACQYLQQGSYALSANVPEGRELDASWRSCRKDRDTALGWCPRKPGEGLNCSQGVRVCNTWGGWVGVTKTQAGETEVWCVHEGRREHSRA